MFNLMFMVTIKQPTATVIVLPQLPVFPRLRYREIILLALIMHSEDHAVRGYSTLCTLPHLSLFLKWTTVTVLCLHCVILTISKGQ